MSIPPDADPASVPVSQAVETTGVPQLDLLLGGGLPRGTLLIVLGPPGSGKTTLASQMAFAAASHYGYQSHFYGRQTAVEDDHLPFAKASIPVMDFIDLDYGYNNSFHHTPEDTIDKLSPKSLEISGNAMLGTLALLNAGAK